MPQSRGADQEVYRCIGIIFSAVCMSARFCAQFCAGRSYFVLQVAAEAPAMIQPVCRRQRKSAARVRKWIRKRRRKLQKDQENGLFLLVNKDPENHLDPSYKAEDLEPIKYYAADRNKYTRFMRAEAAEAFHRLVETAAEEGIDIVMTTAYRSYEFQQILWDNYVAQKGEEEANKTSARPGESEHQTGLAVDLSTSEIDYRNSSDFADTAAGRWVAENAHKFGFILRFPEDKTDITGYSYEPWHIRYVGLTAAADIYEENLTLEEYLEQLEL